MMMCVMVYMMMLVEAVKLVVAGIRWGGDETVACRYAQNRWPGGRCGCV